MQHDLRVLGDLVALLADDRDLARLGHEELAELLELGRRRVSSCEDAEVDPDLQAGRGLLGGKGDDVFDLHYGPYSRLGPGLTLSGLPAESAYCHSHSEEPPGGQDGYGEGLVPELLPVEIDALDQVEEVLQRQNGADRAEHLRVVTGRTGGSGEEGHRQHDDVEDRRRPLERAD